MIDNQSQSQLEAEKDKIISNFKNSASMHTRKSKKVFWAFLIIFLLVVASGGVYAYFSGMFVSLPTLVSKSINNLQIANGVNYDTTINVDISEIKNTTGDLSQIISGILIPDKISLNAKGAYNFSDTNNKKFSSLLTLDAGSFSTTTNLLMSDNIFYAEFIKTPILTFLPVSLTDYENEWFSFPFKTGNTDSVRDSFNQISGIFGIDSNILNKITPEEKKQLYQITQNAHFIKQTKRLSPETINGETAYHFIFDLDREGINSYLQAVKTYINSVGKNDSELSSFDPTFFSKNLSNIQDFKGEVWIGRKDSLPYKIMLDFSIKPDESKNEKVKINIVSIFSDWNKPASIIAPTESTPFETFISDLTTQIKQKTEDETMKSNFEDIKSEAGVFYGKRNSYSAFCSSKELKASRKNIEDNSGTKFICKDSKNKYAVETKLVQDSGYFCIDSSGSMGITQNIVNNTKCP